MKICAIICEFNPFHNGHAYLLEKARKLSGCDFVLCVMSGQFTQRGEICRTDKFLRAKHAVLCGADGVTELYAPFAVAPAEIFARGAVKQICRLDGEITLAFGCESGTEKEFLKAAALLNDESGRFKSLLSDGLDRGESYIRSYKKAFEGCGGDGALLSSPNNILGVEYAKAVQKADKHIDLLPVGRVGAGFGDQTLKDNFSSAGAIRKNADSAMLSGNMPLCSLNDFLSSPDNEARFKTLAADMLFLCEKENLKKIYGLGEGLENRLKKLSDEGLGYDGIVERASGKRYTKTRIARILCANLLELYQNDTEKFLNEPVGCKPLAVKKEAADKLLPLIKPAETANGCEKLTSRAYALWRHLSRPLLIDNPNEKMIIV